MARTCTPTTLFADRLREAFTASGLSDDQIAERADRDVYMLRAYTSGRAVPSRLTLGRLARVLGVDRDDLYDRNDPADPVTRYEAHLDEIVAAAPPMSEHTRAGLRALAREIG